MPRPIEPVRLQLLLCVPTFLAAQGRELEFDVGRWWQEGGTRTSTYELHTRHPLAGPISHGLAVAALVEDGLGRRRAFYGVGYELQAFRGRAAFGPYVLLATALGLSTDTTAQELAALWGVGGGFEWRPFRGVALAVEGRYRVEDRGPRGFWRTAIGAREGFSLAAGLTIGWGRGRGGTAIPLDPPARITGGAADVVHTALQALGAPYQWGGTAENGFDCSGLIQYAYGQHGIRLARVSRDQARAGSAVPPVLEALKPGDILAFAARPGGGVTHVGMYAGEGKFIHSSSSGVKLSLLDARDPEGGWWAPRWVGARRVIQ